MNPFQRGPAPLLLDELGPGAAERFVQRRAEDPAATFNWPHCSYCDSFPVDGTGKKEIDHFKPKGSFPKQVCEWTNPYLGCTACNGQKRSQWSELLLRPDEPGYRFHRYFMIDTLTGELRPNPSATLDDRLRAQTTIDVFGLKRDGLCIERRKDIGRRGRRASVSIEERPFRFLY